MKKDPELTKFVSGTRRFEPPPTTTLSEALETLKKRVREKPYRRSERQIDAAVRLRDRIMGERDED